MNAPADPRAADLAALCADLAAPAWAEALDPMGAARRHRALSGLPMESFLPLLGGATAATQAAAYGAWLAANPGHPQAVAAWFNLGVLHAQASDPARAIACYRNALALKADFAEAAINLGLALEQAGDGAGALAAWQAALQPDEARRQLLTHQGRLKEQMGDFAGAEAALAKSLAIAPDQPDVLQHWTHLRQKLCAWPVHPPTTDLALARRHAGPLGGLALADDIAFQREVVAEWLARKVPRPSHRLAPLRGYGHPRLRIGYLSADFCRHAVAFLMAEVFERHDRSRFEIFGYCSSAEDGSAVRARILSALDHAVLIRELDDAAAAARIRAAEIDILIDLNGLTRGARAGLLAWKPAPVQATYLGYIGSVPLPELDWMICDRVAVPDPVAHLYRPAPLALDGCYQANDRHMPPLPALTRADEGLPAGAPVACCFANFYKITPETFADWMAILHRVPDAVLWLAEDGHGASARLSDAARAAGIDPARLIFGPRVEPARYLARLGLADLFLDTTPYNSGTVASDALRMGLPLLTLAGQAFAARMATSLLTHIGAPELIAGNRAEYVAKAVALLDHAPRRRALGARLAAAWPGTIGDALAFTRRLEAALERVALPA